MKEQIKIEVAYRDNFRCVFCGSGQWLEKTPHHSFFRSEYFKDDKDFAWNRHMTCKNCHFDIHHRGNKKKERLAKEISLSRYTGKYKEELEKIMRAKRFV